MVQDVATAAPFPVDEPSAPDAVLPIGLVRRSDGVYIDVGLPRPALIAAINQVFRAGYYLPGLNYPLMIKALYGVGPDLGAAEAVRLCDDVRLVDPLRVPLYKNPKMGNGYAEYYFEPLYLDEEVLPDGTVVPERQTRLDVDEFVADMWLKGIQFGIDVAAVASAMAASKPDRITFATDLEPEPGKNATVMEVSSDLHRSDAPKARADGRIDLQSFQNRFPQIKANVRLLKKVPSPA